MRLRAGAKREHDHVAANVTRQPRSCAEQLSREISPRSGSTTTTMGDNREHHGRRQEPRRRALQDREMGRGRDARRAAARPRRPDRRASGAGRGCEASTFDVEHTHLADDVRFRPAPHGPGPRSSAVRVQIRSGSTGARPAGSTLAGSVSRSAVDTTAGSCTTTARSGRRPPHRQQHLKLRLGHEIESLHAGDERQVEQLGHLRGPLAPCRRRRSCGRPARGRRGSVPRCNTGRQHREPSPACRSPRNAGR